MVEPIDRRTFLAGTGTAVLGGLTIPGVAGARSGDSPPADDVRTEQVSIFSDPDDPTEVAAGSWIKHRFGWLDAYDESTPEDLDRYRDSVHLTVSIDGDEIDDPDQYWGEPYQTDEGDWILPWSYVTEPKPVGVHEFDVEFYYPDGYYDDGEVREPGTREPWTGYYEVVQERQDRQ